MIGRLVEQQHVGMRNDGLGNRQPFAPAAGELRRLGRKIGKSSPSARLAQASLVLGLGDARANECGFEHIAHRKPGREV